MFEKTYKSMNALIMPDQGLIDDTVNIVRNQNRNKLRKTKLFFRKPIAVVAMIVLCIIFATPALAVNVPVIYDLMYFVSPDIAQFFIPVQEACEDNGIRMEVVSVYIHGSTAEVYITLQDLTSNRIDETIDLFDNYSINRAFDSSATCQLMGFDKKTNTATFLILISEWGNRDIAGRKLTFSIQEFISHKTILEDIAVDISLDQVGEAETVQTVDPNGYGGKKIEPGNHEVLIPGASIFTPLDGLDVTAIGLIAGKLHIQLATAEKLTLDNHGYFYLVDHEGNQVQSEYSLSFVEGMNSSNRVDYQEFVFDIEPDDAGDYMLYGSFWAGGLQTEGRWQVTFSLKK